MSDGEDAMDYLERVKARAIKLHEMSDQGRWDDLEPVFQQMWINAADRELRPRPGQPCHGP